VPPVTGRVAGILLAAGEGSRLGQPKALVELGGQTLAERGVALLRQGGADPLLIVTGAVPLSMAAVHTVHNPDWRSGMGSSLAAGLRALGAGPDASADADAGAEPDAGTGSGAAGAGDEGDTVVPGDCVAVVIALADQPLVGATAVRRLIAAYRDGATVAVAAYDGKPRNPVLIAREHWDAVVTLATGDAGARPFLRANPDLVTLVECGDTGSAYDVDTPEDLARVRGVSGLRSAENALFPTGR
jgi:CTP:molybdopterin cytidylyltransferase MocA